VSRVRSEAVVALGKELVAELEAGDDMLASWMAHHIANLMAKAEAAPADQAAGEACAHAILELWRHRSALPQHLRPLGEIEPVLRTLAYLDLDPTENRYYRTPIREAILAGVEGEAKRAIEMAMGVDFTARLLIRTLLQQAAALTLDGSEAWIELATAAGMEDTAEHRILVLIDGEEGAETPGFDTARAALDDRAGRLEAFAAVAAEEAAAIRGRLSNDEEPGLEAVPEDLPERTAPHGED
jgi:hypothetical protein